MTIFNLIVLIVLNIAFFWQMVITLKAERSGDYLKAIYELIWMGLLLGMLQIQWASM